MKKKTAKPRVKTDREKFAILRGRIKKIGFYEKSPDWLMKVLIEKSLIPPDSKRIPETFDQLIYARKVNGYTILFISSFNPTINKTFGSKVNGAFSKKGGSIWILVLDVKGQRIVTRQRFRTKSMNDRIPLELECLVFGLKKRPMHENGRSKMVLWDPSSSFIPNEVEVSRQWYKENILKNEKRNSSVKYELVWLSINSATSYSQSFSKGMRGLILEVYDELTRQRSYYWSVERKRRKTKKTIKKIRRPWEMGDTDTSSAPSERKYAVSLSC